MPERPAHLRTNSNPVPPTSMKASEGKEERIQIPERPFPYKEVVINDVIVTQNPPISENKAMSVLFFKTIPANVTLPQPPPAPPPPINANATVGTPPPPAPPPPSVNAGAPAAPPPPPSGFRPTRIIAPETPETTLQSSVAKPERKADDELGAFMAKRRSDMHEDEIDDDEEDFEEYQELQPQTPQENISTNKKGKPVEKQQAAGEPKELKDIYGSDKMIKNSQANAPADTGKVEDEDDEEWQ